MTTILHIFRAIHENTSRGTLSVLRDEDGLVLYFDSRMGRSVMGCHRFHLLDINGEPAELPDDERALGKVRTLVSEFAGEPDERFKIYSRLPVPPTGATVRTATVTVHRDVRVAAKGASR